MSEMCFDDFDYNRNDDDDLDSNSNSNSNSDDKKEIDIQIDRHGDIESVPCTCQRCGKFYKVDVIVDDELWENHVKPKNKPKDDGLVCGSCIMKAIEDIGDYGAFRLIKI